MAFDAPVYVPSRNYSLALCGQLSCRPHGDIVRRRESTKQNSLVNLSWHDASLCRAARGPCLNNSPEQPGTRIRNGNFSHGFLSVAYKILYSESLLSTRWLVLLPMSPFSDLPGSNNPNLSWSIRRCSLRTVCNQYHTWAIHIKRIYLTNLNSVRTRIFIIMKLYTKNTKVKEK